MFMKLVYDEWDEIYFYYGVFSERDYTFINSKLRCCHYEFKSPKINYFQYFDEIMSIYDDRHELQDQNGDQGINMSRLEAYNFYIKDEILEMSKKMTKTFSYAIERVNRVKIFDGDMLKRKAKLIVFIITESYLNSNFFKKDLNDAKSMEKEIILLVDEKIKDFDQQSFKEYKSFLVSEDVFYPWDFIYTIQKKLKRNLKNVKNYLFFS